MQTIIHHYTNIEVLSLILKNRTLRFNRLDRVDDPEESNFISNGVDLGPYTFCVLLDGSEGGEHTDVEDVYKGELGCSIVGSEGRIV